MKKTKDGTVIVSYGMEYAVQYDVNGEKFITECDDDEHARLIRAVLDGKILCREHFVEEAWAEIDLPGLDEEYDDEI